MMRGSLWKSIWEPSEKELFSSLQARYVSLSQPQRISEGGLVLIHQILNLIQ